MEQAIPVVTLVFGGEVDDIAVASRRGDIVPSRGGRLPGLAAVLGDVVPTVASVTDAHQDTTIDQFRDFGLVAAHRSAARHLPSQAVVVGINSIIVQGLRRAFADGCHEHNATRGSAQSITLAEIRSAPSLVFRDDTVVAKDEMGDVLGLRPNLAVVITA